MRFLIQTIEIYNLVSTALHMILPNKASHVMHSLGLLLGFWRDLHAKKLTEVARLDFSYTEGDIHQKLMDFCSNFIQLDRCDKNSIIRYVYAS